MLGDSAVYIKKDDVSFDPVIPNTIPEEEIISLNN
jgi:hypothetical protein